MPEYQSEIVKSQVKLNEAHTTTQKTVALKNLVDAGFDRVSAAKIVGLEGVTE